MVGIGGDDRQGRLFFSVEATSVSPSGGARTMVVVCANQAVETRLLGAKSSGTGS